MDANPREVPLKRNQEIVMPTKILSAILVSGLLLAAGSSAFASESGGNGGYGDSPYVQVVRERQPDGSTIITTTTPGGVEVVVRNAKGKIVSRKHTRNRN
jgi:hypothetical protein